MTFNSSAVAGIEPVEPAAITGAADLVFKVNAPTFGGDRDEVAWMRPGAIYLGSGAATVGRGGAVVVSKGKTLALVELPIAGLMSDERAEIVAAKADQLVAAMKS